MQFWYNHNPSKHLFLYPILLLIPFPGDNCGHLKAQTLDSFFYFLPSSTWIIVTASTLTVMLITPKSVALTSHLSSYPLSLCAYHWRLLPGFLTTKYPSLLRFLSMKEVCVCVCVCVCVSMVWCVFYLLLVPLQTVMIIIATIFWLSTTCQALYICQLI